MNIPKELKYAKTHEWAESKSGAVRVGISDHAQHEISDIVHVELPEINAEVKKGQPVAVVESVKAAFDVYAPVSGVISSVNEIVVEAPEKINQDPYGEGWFFEIKPSGTDNIDDLMDSGAYDKFLSEETPK